MSAAVPRRRRDEPWGVSLALGELEVVEAGAGVGVGREVCLLVPTPPAIAGTGCRGVWGCAGRSSRPSSSRLGTRKRPPLTRRLARNRLQVGGIGSAHTMSDLGRHSVLLRLDPDTKMQPKRKPKVMVKKKW